ncbi:MAG: MarR family transcriptional regulator [Ruminococcaceae bacterium]|nr:MarR family transcriptional regulator [Oscillospiraceae bacterium]
MKDNFKDAARPPEREELTNNPMKMCHDVSHIFHSKLRKLNESEEAPSNRGTRLVLSFLAVNDGVTQLELVNATHLKAPTISIILQKLEADGLVERKKDEKDMRVTRVYLTDEGREEDRRNIAKIKEMDTIALSGLTEKECETLMLLLGKIRDNLLGDMTAEKGREEKI